MESASLITRTETGTDGRAIIVAEGDIDLTTVEILRKALDGAIDDHRSVVLDVGDVGFIDSSGLNVFAWGHQRAHAAGGSLRLRRPSPMLRRLLEITAMDSILLVDGDVPLDAINKRSDPRE
jgi:anti-anti-sigma factor